MPICPKCRSEYEKGIEVCAECQVELEDIILIECGNCHESVNQLIGYCPHCGYSVEGEDSEYAKECDNHPDSNAIGACVVCGKPVCEKCSAIHNKKIFCDNDEHVRIFGDWAVVFSCGTEYEAQMVKANVEMAGIQCMVFSQKDNVFFTNIGDTAVINVMVPKEKINEAEEIIEQIFDGNFIGEADPDENE
jgi:hypothetical protein